MNSSYTRASSASRSLTTKEIVLAGLFSAILAIISQISIPMPTGVPITIQVFGIALVGVILGWRLGLLSTLVYILLGAVGLPIFANFRGGISSLTGLTGGYIWSWPLMVVLCGIRPKQSNKRLQTSLIFVFALLGLAVNEIIGCLQWAFLAGDMSMKAVFTYAMVAFIPKDTLITILAVITGLQIRKILVRSGSLPSA
jgi:biotin transport system substrate-specific component